MPSSKLTPDAKLNAIGRAVPDLTPRSMEMDAERVSFYRNRWIPLLSEAYGYQSLGSENPENAPPIVEVTSLLSGKRGISLPFFDFCYPKRSTPMELDESRVEAIELGKRRGWKYLETRGGFERTERYPESLTFLKHTIALNDSSDAQFESLKPAAQRAIRKAKKSGVQVEISTTIESLGTFYQLQCLTRRRHGLPPQPKSFFRTFHSKILKDGNGTVITASLNGTPIASSIYVQQDSETVHYKYGASDFSFQNYRGNNLVMWLASRYFAEKGYKLIDLGRNSQTNQEGLRKYKLSWSAIETQEHYQRYDLKLDKIVPMRDNAFGAHNFVFSKLPISINKLISNVIYKHIA